MSSHHQTLYQLLPAIHRIRDAELAKQQGLERGPLEELISIVAEQLAVMQENIEQSYDDLFIETCADWLTPYIGDLIAYQSLHGNVPNVASPRSEVAHTIALRRRKGTAVVLEQLARDVTGWNARAVEFFQQLAWTQNMNHIRNTVHYSPSMRDSEPLDRINGAFNTVKHTIDVRRVKNNRGQFNIPNIGIFLWRLEAHPHTECPALQFAPRRYFCSQLGHNLPLYSRPRVTQDGIISELSKAENVPEPLSRRQLKKYLSLYASTIPSSGADQDMANPSIHLQVAGNPIARDQLRVCNLSDDPDTGVWAHQPKAGEYAIDPELGRIALPPEEADDAEVLVSYHRGFSADMAGGEYDRETSFALQDVDTILVPDQQSTIQDALNAMSGNTIIQITDNGRYEESLSVNIIENTFVELRAKNGRFPHLVLNSAMSVSGGEGSRFYMNGLLISTNSLEVPNNGLNQLSELHIDHCTLVPGQRLEQDGSAVTADAVSISVAIEETQLHITRSICGAIRAVPDSEVIVTDSIIDATDDQQVAYADIDSTGPGATLSATSSTIIGKVHTRQIEIISNSILFARLNESDSWNAAIWCERKQTGCVRFSFLPFESIVPRRYRCQPDSTESARRLSPRFTTLRFGTAGYAQLSPYTSEAIWRGADDESEMGAFHHLFAPQRDRNLRIRMREYLRVGLQAGLFYAS